MLGFYLAHDPIPIFIYLKRGKQDTCTCVYNCMYIVHVHVQCTCNVHVDVDVCNVHVHVKCGVNVPLWLLWISKQNSVHEQDLEVPLATKLN